MLHTSPASAASCGRAHIGVIAALAAVALASVGAHGMHARRSPLGVDLGPPRGPSTAITFINAGVHILNGGAPIGTDPYLPQAGLLGVGNLQGANGPSG
jgi:hypothetical protein